MVTTMPHPKDDIEKSLKDLNLTNQELDRFSKAFKDPEFLKLFHEYAQELSDPKNKAENDAYLRQLEAEGRGEEVYGKGVQLIIPKEQFVIKTKNKVNSQKVFINVCTSEKVDPMVKKQATDEKGNKGVHVDLPLTLGHAKEGKDKVDKPCLVFDFVVHPETFKASCASIAIRDMMAHTAMEKIEGVQGTSVNLVRAYKMLKTLKYYPTPECDKPRVLAVRPTSSESKVADGRIKPLPQEPIPPVLGADKDKDKHEGAAARSNFSFPTAKPKAAAAKTAAKIMDPATPGFKHEGGEVTPDWTLVHRGDMDLAEAWGDAGRHLALNTSHPKELVVRIPVPGCPSAAELDLDVSSTRIKMTAPGKYKLDAALPFAVNDTKGRAKFDKSRQVLEVVLPTLLPPPPKAPLVKETPAIEEVEQSSEPADESASPADESAASSTATPSTPADSSPEPATAAAPLVHEVATPSQAPGQPTDQSAAASANAGHEKSATSETTMSEAQRKWAELHSQKHPAAVAEQTSHLQASEAGDSSPSEVTGNSGSASSSGAAQSATPSASTQAAAAAPAPPPPTPAPQVQLKPRLSRALVAELD